MVGGVEGVTPSQAVGVASSVAGPLPVAKPVRDTVPVTVGGVGEGEESSVLLGPEIVGVPTLDGLGMVGVRVGARGVSEGLGVEEGVGVPSRVDREVGLGWEVGKLVMEPIGEEDTP